MDINNVSNFFFVIGLSLLFFGIGIELGQREGSYEAKRELMREAHKLGYATQIVDDNDNVSYEWKTEQGEVK